jgi:hypothetical protein
MKKILFILVFFVNMTGYAQEVNDNEDFNDILYDFESSKGITVYAEQPKEYAAESKNAYVLNQINGSFSDRKQFIETDFLDKSGFRRNADVKYRKTTASEKIYSVLSGVVSIFSNGLTPIKPFFGIEYDKLPKGEAYKFESVFIKSDYKDVSPEVLTVMELEYMLQIEFRNGIIIHDNINNYSNVNYYTDENINKFEKLILELPNAPESIYQAKNRYLNELPRIKAAFERYKNPSENYLRAVQNLKN